MRRLLNLLLLLALIAVLVGCGGTVPGGGEASETTSSSSEVASTEPAIDSQSQASGSVHLTYSNLADEGSREEVRSVLEKAGVSPERIVRFFDQVDLFNRVVENKTLSEGFVTIEGPGPEYDLVAMQELWESKQPDLLGYNCRLTTFGLMGDRVGVGNPSIDSHLNLVFDEEVIRSQPGLFTDQELASFIGLFSEVETERTKDVQVHLQKIKESWNAQKITFPNDEKRRWIFVFFHLDDGQNTPTLFIGHAGILLPTEDGSLLFIEKLSFQEPYQAVWFSDRVALNDYLMNKYDIEWDQPTASPFILENDVLLEGYRTRGDASGN